MPVVFYTKAEHDLEVGVLKSDNLNLAKLFCEKQGIDCVATNMGDGYCYECPIKTLCSYNYKRSPK